MSEAPAAGTNPYRAPVAGDAAWDPEVQAQLDRDLPRTSGPKAFGVLSIVFAGLTILTSTCSVAFDRPSNALERLDVQRSKDPQAARRAYARYHGVLGRVTGWQSGVFVVMSAALLVLGVGQLRYRGWARRGTVAWCWLALAWLLGTIFLWYYLQQPAVERLYEELGAAAPAGSPEARVNATVARMLGGPWIMIISLLTYSPYPLVLLAYFTRPRVQAMMRG